MIDMELLASYADGPRIWDAAAILPAVSRLEEQGLIEPVPGRDDGAHQLTAKGRRALPHPGRCYAGCEHDPGEGHNPVTGQAAND